MGRIMIRRFLLKIINTLLLLAVAVTAIGAWTTFKERNVNAEAVSANISNITADAHEMKYIQISGGMTDLTNTYEYTTSTRKSKINLDTTYYVPIITKDGESNNLGYILKSDSEPQLSDMLKEANYKGLLESSEEIPEDLITALSTTYPNIKSAFILNSGYTPEPMAAKLIRLAIFVVICLVFFFIRKLLIGKPEKSTAEEPVENSQQEAA